jgi:hypothetical protein
MLRRVWRADARRSRARIGAAFGARRVHLHRTSLVDLVCVLLPGLVLVLLPLPPWCLPLRTCCRCPRARARPSHSSHSSQATSWPTQRCVCAPSVCVCCVLASLFAHCCTSCASTSRCVSHAGSAALVVLPCHGVCDAVNHTRPHATPLPGWQARVLHAYGARDGEGARRAAGVCVCVCARGNDSVCWGVAGSAVLCSSGCEAHGVAPRQQLVFTTP